MKKILLMLAAFVCLKAFSQCASQTVIQNPTFQGASCDTFTGWIPCVLCTTSYAFESAAGDSGISLSAGIPTGGINRQGGITQKLNLPLVGGTGIAYTLHFKLISLCGGYFGRCKIYLGFSPCDTNGQEIYASNLAGTGTTWEKDTVTFHPNNDYTYITIEALTSDIYDTYVCMGVDSFTLTSSAIPLTLNTHVNNNSCSSGSNGTATAQAAGIAPFTYSWSNGQTDSILTNVAAGIYAVTITDATGCTVSDSTTITQQSALSETATLIGTTLTACRQS